MTRALIVSCGVQSLEVEPPVWQVAEVVTGNHFRSKLRVQMNGGIRMFAKMLHNHGVAFRRHSLCAGESGIKKRSQHPEPFSGGRGSRSTWVAARLLEMALEQGGRPDAGEFIRWRWKHGLSLTDAAEALGLSRRQVAYYASGEHAVPRTVLLACKGWEVERQVAA